MADGLWLVPGAPLPAGRGWRVWVSRRGNGALEAPAATVRLERREVQFTTRWEAIAGIPGFDRQAGCLEIELQERNPGAAYEVSFPSVGPDPFQWRTLPERLRPAAASDGDGAALTIMVSSCFYRPNDAEGAYAAGLRELCRRNGVHLKLLVGDQIYQDWPLAMPLTPALAMFTARYETYWGDDPMRAALALTPNLFVSDDHEYWNDYPERQFHLAHTWTAGLRERYGDMARATYDFYQKAANPAGATFSIIEVPPLSIFLADSRHDRDPVSSIEPHFFGRAQWEAFTEWAAGRDGPAVLVIGQPLFQLPGDWKDHTLANFSADYARLWKTLGTILDRGHDVLVLTGDIHWGRYATTETATGARLHELVASPASNVAQGPFVGSRSGAGAPTKITTPIGQGVRVWSVATTTTDRVPTNDNNVSLVRFESGTNGRVRTRASIWRIRPVDTRWFWQPPPELTEPPLRMLFNTEFQLA